MRFQLPYFTDAGDLRFMDVDTDRPESVSALFLAAHAGFQLAKVVTDPHAADWEYGHWAEKVREQWNKLEYPEESNLESELNKEQ